MFGIISFNKSYLDKLFTELGDRITSDAEITICGGSAVVLNYGFRDATTDIDLIQCYGIPDSLISTIAKEKDLPSDWMNTNVTVTLSYSKTLLQWRQLYRVYNHLYVYTISGEALLCMKLKSFRSNSQDAVDIYGIIEFLKRTGKTYDDVVSVLRTIYHEDSTLSVEAEQYLKELMGVSEYVLDDESLQSYSDMLDSGTITIEDIPTQFRQQVLTYKNKAAFVNPLFAATDSLL